jgi:nucleoside-diphosphate-sugar epimerase
MFTVLGSKGFIGGHLARQLAQLDLECYAPARDESLIQKNLGTVVYCLGLTADFRSRPFDTVTAHVCLLNEVLRNCKFDSLLYLSSARVYDGRKGTAHEDDPLRMDPAQGDHLYNISKAMGESLTLNSGRPAHVVRLSNVYGDDYASQNFLAEIMRDAILKQKVVLQTSLDSEKDYINVRDVVQLLVKIVTEGRQRIYNLAGGANVSHRALTDKLSELTGCRVEMIENAPTITFPTISIDRIREEFGFQPSALLDDLEELVDRHPDRRAGQRS